MGKHTVFFEGKEIEVDDSTDNEGLCYPESYTPHDPSCDAIHHPDHYIWKGTECKDIIQMMTAGLSGVEAYYMGNIIKYLYRYPKKGTLLSDLAKAEEYTKFLRELFIEEEP